MQNDDLEFYARVAEPTYFRAPKSLIDCCIDCGCAIQPGEIIVALGHEFIHEGCIESHWEN